MARYLFQASYTSEAWAVQVSNPQNRIDAIRSVIERLGGRLESAYLSFGDYDVVVIAEMPDASVPRPSRWLHRPEGHSKPSKRPHCSRSKKAWRPCTRRQGQGIAHQDGYDHRGMRTPP
jgi:hypothetical protein